MQIMVILSKKELLKASLPTALKVDAIVIAV
jgi:hypothetical protein